MRAHTIVQSYEGPHFVPTGIRFSRRVGRDSVGPGLVTGVQIEATTTHPDEASVSGSARAFSVVVPYLPSRRSWILIPG